MASATRFQHLILIFFGMVMVALMLYAFDPLHTRLRHQHDYDSTMRTKEIDPLYVKGFKQIDSQYFIVMLDGVPNDVCPCDDLRVIRNKKPQCPVVHHRTKKAIIDRGRRLGLPEHNFPVLEVCP